MKRTVLGLAVISFCAFCAAASAQKPMTGPNPAQAKAAAYFNENKTVTRTELKSLVQSLESEANRRKLISQLNAMVEAGKAPNSAGPKKTFGARILDLMSARLDRLTPEIVAGTRAIMDLPNIYDWAVRQVSDESQRSRWLEVGWKLLLAIVVGLIG